MKRFRTNNGLEFCSEAFIDFCKANAIARHKIVVGTPQQNGLAERFNRTSLERVRCMLLSAYLPKTFWAETATTTTYLINRCLSTTLDMETPEEIWSNHPPKLDQLKVFGCVAYAHIRQDKLDPSVVKCMFLGYPEGVKGYKLWCLELGHKKCLISRDVVLNENIIAYQDKFDLTKPSTSDTYKTKSERVNFEVEQISKGGQATKNYLLSDKDDDESEQQTSELDNYQLARDRVRRETKAHERYGYADLIAFALFFASEVLEEEPKSYEEVLASKEKGKWLRTMNEEIKYLHDNNTWELIRKPPDSKLVSCKWIYKRKEGIFGVEPERFEARLVARGFTQKERIDYNEVFLTCRKT